MYKLRTEKKFPILPSLVKKIKRMCGRRDKINKMFSKYFSIFPLLGEKKLGGGNKSCAEYTPLAYIWIIHLVVCNELIKLVVFIFSYGTILVQILAYIALFIVNTIEFHNIGIYRLSSISWTNPINNFEMMSRCLTTSTFPSSRKP